MQNLENDMDDLFRKAVKHYSLKPCKSEWNELSARLSYNSVNIFRIRRYFTIKKGLSILFCLLGIAIGVIIPTDSMESYKVHHAAILLNETHIKNLRLIAEKNKIGHTGESFHRKNCWQIPEQTILNDNRRYLNDLIFLMNHANEDSNLTNSRGSLQINSPNENLPVFTQANLTVNTQQIELTNRDPKNLHTSLQKLDRHGRGFYYGVVLGPLWSQVRHYEFTRPGFDFGLTVGYKLNRKISIETGVLRTKEYYYVGKKNSSSNSGTPGVDNLEGSREALQIPFNFNYQLIQTKSASLFMSAGFSSFVGVDEKTSITGSNNPISLSQGNDYGFTSYLPSYLSIGVGGEFRVGKLANIRIEPYSQIPLKSAVGNTIYLGPTRQNLQFFNAGLRIGITRFIR